MKRFLFGTIVCFMLVVLLSPIQAKADILWESNDSFSKSFNGQKTIEQRTYIVSSDKGFEVLYESPVSTKTLGYLSNGEEFFAYYIYEVDGHRWGLNSNEQYMLLDNCIVKYDYISFEEDFGSEIKDTGRGELLSFPENTVLWNYPGGSVSYVFNGELKEVYPSKMYTDENGNEWYFLNYTYGIRNVWVNATNPTLKELSNPLAVEEPKVPEPVVPSQADIKAATKLDITSKTSESISLLCAILATGAVSAVALFFIKRISKKDLRKEDFEDIG